MELINYGTYQEYKQQLDTELRKTTESFVRIGYLLKVAKDTTILKESGYANVYDFAQAEYNIDKSQVSRFMNINDRFSEGGYSDRLKEQFRGFGHAKLTIMLQLPDEINEELNPGFSKSEIQAIKEEVDEENKITELEVLMEGQDRNIEELENNLHKFLWQLGKDIPELYVSLYGAVEEGVQAVYETMAPDGEKIYTIRIQGVGRMMLSLKGTDKPVSLVNIRSNEKEEYSWDDLLCYMEKLMAPEELPERSWSMVYGEEFPKKAEVAPVQPQREEKKVVKKETKVSKAKISEPKEEPKEEKTEEQLPGQDSILNHPEYLPEGMKTAQEQDNGTEGVSNQGTLDVGGNDTQTQETGCGTDAEDSTTAGTGEETAEEAIQNITKETEVVEELPAAVVEEIENIWDKTESTEMRLTMFFDEYDEKEKRQSEVFKRDLRKAYQDAVSVAAGLERMINHV